MPGYCCDMRGFLSFLVLFLLSKKPRSGEEISKEIEKRKGAKPSPGTIYPVLKKLESEGLVSSKKSGKSIVYSLTLEGKRGFEEAKRHFCRIFVDVL